MKKYGFGVDVGGTTCKIGFFENSGNMLDKWEIKTNTENHGASILDDIVASLESKLADAGICKDEVEGVGIGVPGPVKNDSVVCECVNLGWGTFDVAETLSEKIGLPVKVGNDANVAALGEMWKAAARDVRMVSWSHWEPVSAAELLLTVLSLAVYTVPVERSVI